MLLLGKDLIGNPIVSIENGQILGHVKDVYVDKPLHVLEGVYLGSQGVFNRQAQFIGRKQIATIGQDTVLVQSTNTIQEGEESPLWLRRDDFLGRDVNTPGGTKIGTVDDIILDEKGYIVGVALGRVYVEGPVARNRAVKRTAVLDTGQTDGTMTIELSRAEDQKMGVDASLFSDATVKIHREGDVEKPEKSPYTAGIEEDEGLDHATPEEPFKSPYVTGEPPQKTAEEAGFRSPYTTPEPKETPEEETFKSPYATPEAVKE